MKNTSYGLPHISEAISEGRGYMIVEHDRLAAHQTCARCRKTWGDGVDEYAQVGVRVGEYDDGTTCPDEDCGGTMGIRADQHADWIDGGHELPHYDANGSPSDLGRTGGEGMTKTRLDEAVAAVLERDDLGISADALREVLARYITDTPAPTEETHDKLYVVGYHDPAFPDDPVVGVALTDKDAERFADEDLGAARPVNEFRVVIWKPKLQRGVEDLGDVEAEAWRRHDWTKQWRRCSPMSALAIAVRSTPGS